jgi:preprotein translocase subunit SecF
MNFIKLIPLYFLLSLLVIAPGVYSLVVNRLNLSVDFTGGSQIELKSSNPSNLTKSLPLVFPDSSITTKDQKIIIDTKTLSQKELDEAVGKLKNDDKDLIVENFVSVGPSAGTRLIQQTVAALGLAVLGILLYVTRAFKSIKYGLAAILAILHDSLVILGSFSLLGHYFAVKVDLLFVTALLTSLSFSVHDTIVVFFCNSEVKKKSTKLNLSDHANLAINQTLGRSINNSMTIIFMLSASLVFSQGSLRNFILALLIGAITGTYSSTFSAIPLLVSFERLKRTKK